MRVDAFDFDLPPEFIALRPSSPRDAARLMVVRQGDIEDHVVRDLPRLLQPGDMVVFNDTSVIPARLKGERTRNGHSARIELLLHQRLAGATWAAFARPAKRLKAGDRVAFGNQGAAVMECREAGEVVVAFDDLASFEDVLRQHGEMPLPPYIVSQRQADERDLVDYQTVFGREAGAVAAPTAGLHFTPQLLDAIKAAGIESGFVTLHVGAGTFLPVKAEDTDSHKMHAERGEISGETAAAINSARARGGRIVAIGTTALRLLESAVDDSGFVRPYSGSTDIFITPGYRFRAVDLLWTNFHLPKSTLFMLVAAFVGLARAHEIYARAKSAGYRFYSYGDASLLERSPA